MERVRRRDARRKGVRGSIFRSVFFAYYSAHDCDGAADPLRVRSLTILREKIKEVKKNRKRVCII